MPILRKGQFEKTSKTDKLLVKLNKREKDTNYWLQRYTKMI